MLMGLIYIPALFALFCLVLPGSLVRRLALVVGAGAHFALIMRSWSHPMVAMWGGVVALDPLGQLFLTIISGVFLATAVCFVGYHRKTLLSQRIFLACMLALLAALSLVCMSQHLGLMWVALEASSLAVIPLIYFRLGARALEATWKFLLMNSVGVALALLGTFAIALSTTHASAEGGLSLILSNLVGHAGALDPKWLRVGFLMAMVGYGTKIGLAPMHSWKPDAYGEAPPPIAGFLAGGMTLAAFLGLLRVFQICVAAGEGPFAGMWMIVFGLLSIAVAAVFIIGNPDYRRLLAYTSVEHMGVMVLGIGLGVSSAYGGYASMLHAMHNALNKGALFFTAGILWRIYGSSQIGDIRGTIHRHRVVAILLLLGLCATSGVPPFGMFFSEIGILIASVKGAGWYVTALFALTLAVVFVGTWTALLPMVFGKPSEEAEGVKAEGSWREWVMVTPVVVLLGLGLGLGAYQPAGVRRALENAAESVFRGKILATEVASPGVKIDRPVSVKAGEVGHE